MACTLSTAAISRPHTARQIPEKTISLFVVIVPPSWPIPVGPAALPGAGDRTTHAAWEVYGNRSAIGFIRAAVLHELAVIGEAAATVSTVTRDRRPKLPWRETVAFRRHRMESIRIVVDPPDPSEHT